MTEKNLWYLFHVFFRLPEEPFDRLDDPDDGSMDANVGTLYLLRRELIETGFNVTEIVPEDSFRGSDIQRRAFATAILVFTGIDLLGKFLAGNDQNGKVGERFTAYCTSFMELDPEQAGIVWDLRNALMHSFGIGSVKGTPFIVQTQAADDVVTRTAGGMLALSITSLYWRFIDSVPQYERQVRKDSALQAKFKQMFDTYGMLFLAPGPVQR